MNRRQFIRQLTTLIASGAVGYALDIDKLLWVPGQKKIFLPSGIKLTDSQIIALELERILPSLKMLFERDDLFYTAIKNHKTEVISSREIKIPLTLKPGKWRE